MCGDGANDCGALKAAHVGISLSEAESSVASPFTYKEQNITCVPKVIKEGRAALVTSFGVFKIMVCYSLTELASVIILYNIDANLGSPEFLFIDVFLILNFASVFGLTQAYSALSNTSPPLSLMAVVPITSMICFLTVATGFQVLGNYWIQTYDWFTPFVYNENVLTFICYENYAVYCVSMFQYVAMAIVFSKGKPYRQPIYKNLLLSLSLIATTTVCLYMTLYPHQWLADVMELKIPPMEGRIAMAVIGFISLFCSFVVEELFVECLFGQLIMKRVNALRKFRKERRLQELCETMDLSNLNTNGFGMTHPNDNKQNGIVNNSFVASRDVLTS